MILVISGGLLGEKFSLIQDTENSLTFVIHHNQETVNQNGPETVIFSEEFLNKFCRYN